MRVADIRELFAYNAWANARLLAAAATLTAAEFAAPTRFPRRSLRGYLVHVQNAVRFHLGQWEGDFPDLDRPRTITFAGDGVRVTAPPWKHTAHIVNHGTQHRSDAAQLLTELGHSPGDLDLLDSQPMTPIEGWGAPHPPRFDVVVRGTTLRGRSRHDASCWTTAPVTRITCVRFSGVEACVPLAASCGWRGTPVT